MDTVYYLDKFQKAADELDKKLLKKKEMETQTGIWLKSVVLRLQKNYWANTPYEKPQTGAAIFFSIWISDASVKEGKLLYNIHSLKLRQLKGYSLTSIKFAAAFREKFKQYEHHWPNVSVDFGPLTLMQGWKKIDEAHFKKDILGLANKFLTIDFIIDDLLNEHKLPAHLKKPFKN